MVIIGTGVDIIEIPRIIKAASNESFQHKVYTDAELRESKLQGHRLAGFFAAKEALLKAMGTGLAGFSWKEIEIHHNMDGAPYFKVYDKVACFMHEQQVTRIHLSISHCREYAVAHVILEALK